MRFLTALFCCLIFSSISHAMIGKALKNPTMRHILKPLLQLNEQQRMYIKDLFSISAAKAPMYGAAAGTLHSMSERIATTYNDFGTTETLPEHILFAGEHAAHLLLEPPLYGISAAVLCGLFVSTPSASIEELLSHLWNEYEKLEQEGTEE